jgi:hypothetical protein
MNTPGAILASVKSNNLYEGYLNFPNPYNNFQLCSVPGWSGTVYGWGGSQTTLGTSGGNCYYAGPNYCQVVADVKGLTIAFTQTNWVLSGDFNGWSVTANPMTFDATTNQWTATGVSLTAGTGIKFVGDPAWKTMYGVDSKGRLAQGSQTSIVVRKTGTFTVTLDLSHGAGNYNYSIK